MKLFPFFPVFCLALSSCATIFNARTQRVDIITNTPAKVVINDETIYGAGNRTKILAVRDLRPLVFTVVNDSIKKEIVVDSKNSTAYWLNLYPSLGLGMLVDKDKPKRYAYPWHIYIDMTDTEPDFTSYKPWYDKGEIYLHISAPYINTFLFYPEKNNTRVGLGFWGISTGIDWYYSDLRYLNLSVSAVTNFILPFPAPIDFSGEYDVMSSDYFTISNNYRVRRFSLGYGISFSRNIWDHRYATLWDPPPPVRDPVKLVGWSIGLVFPLYWQCLEHFGIGLIYRPSFYQIRPSFGFAYEHLISLDLAWKIRMRRGIN